MLRKIYRFLDVLRDRPLVTLITMEICWIAFSIMIFAYFTDHTPATQRDYEPLIKQQTKITKDFNSVYGYDNYSILPDDDNVKVTLSNDQCELICSFDKNFKFIKSEKKDLAMTMPAALFVSFFMGFLLGGIFAFVITISIPFILSCLLKLLEKICRLLV